MRSFISLSYLAWSFSFCSRLFPILSLSFFKFYNSIVTSLIFTTCFSIVLYSSFFSNLNLSFNSWICLSPPIFCSFRILSYISKSDYNSAAFFTVNSKFLFYNKIFLFSDNKLSFNFSAFFNFDSFSVLWSSCSPRSFSKPSFSFFKTSIYAVNSSTYIMNYEYWLLALLSSCFSLMPFIFYSFYSFFK